MEIYLVIEMDFEGAAWGASRVAAAFTLEEDAKTHCNEYPNAWVQEVVLDAEVAYGS